MSQNSYNPYENPNPSSFLEEDPSTDYHLFDLEYATDPIDWNEVQQGAVDMGTHYMNAQRPVECVDDSRIHQMNTVVGSQPSVYSQQLDEYATLYSSNLLPDTDHGPSYSYVYDDQIGWFPQPQTYPDASTAIQDQVAQASGRAGYQWYEDPNDAHAYWDTNELVPTTTTTLTPTPTTSGGQTGSRSMASIKHDIEGKGRAQNSAASTSGIPLPPMTAEEVDEQFKLAHRAESQEYRDTRKAGEQRFADLMRFDLKKVKRNCLLDKASDEIEERWRDLNERDASIAKLKAENAALKAALRAALEAQRGGVPP